MKSIENWSNSPLVNLDRATRPLSIENLPTCIPKKWFLIRQLITLYYDVSWMKWNWKIKNNILREPKQQQKKSFFSGANVFSAFLYFSILSFFFIFYYFFIFIRDENCYFFLVTQCFWENIYGKKLYEFMEKKKTWFAFVFQLKHSLVFTNRFWY